MKTIRETVKGIGSVLRPSHDRKKIVAEATLRLVRSQNALEFINSAGWREMMTEYKGMVMSLREHLRGLCRHSKMYQREIQHTSDFIDALETVISMTDKVVVIHNAATQTIQVNKETAQGTGIKP